MMTCILDILMTVVEEYDMFYSDCLCYSVDDDDRTVHCIQYCDDLEAF